MKKYPEKKMEIRNAWNSKYFGCWRERYPATEDHKKKVEQQKNRFTCNLKMINLDRKKRKR